MTSYKAVSTQARQSRSTRGLNQCLFSLAMLSAIVLISVGPVEAAGLSAQKTFRPSKNMIGIKNRIDEGQANPIISYITTKVSSEPTADSMVSLLNDMAAQYQEELLTIRTNILNSQSSCTTKADDYDYSIELREAYLDVLSASYDLEEEHVEYYEDRLEYLTQSEEASLSTSSVTESVLQDIQGQSSVMIGILESTADSLDDLIETVVTLEPTSMTSVNDPGYNVDMIQEKRTETMQQLQDKMVNLVQFSQADLSLAYNELNILQQSMYEGYDRYQDRESAASIQLGNIESSLELFGEAAADQEEAIASQQIHLSTMTDNYEIIIQAVKNAIARYEQESATFIASCTDYQDESDLLTIQIEAGLELITQLEVQVMDDYESLYYFLNNLNSEYGGTY